MKKSWVAKLTIIYLALLIGVIGITLLLVDVFLPKYYLAKSEFKLVLSYEEINEAISNEDFDREQFETDLEKDYQTWNISAFIMGDDGEIFFSNNTFEGILKGSLIDKVFDDAAGEIHVGEPSFPKEPVIPEKDNSDSEAPKLHSTREEIIKETDNYILQKVKDSRIDLYFLEMWGTLENGWDFILRTPLDGIAQSADIANSFIIYVGIIAAILGFVAILLLVKRTTNPIKELSQLSIEMANLNFNEKYTGTRTDEIGILGDNFNKMSESLEKTISELKAANMRLEKDLENKNRLEEMRSEFIGNISHELKTPVALIQGYAEGLRSGIAENEEEWNNYCEIISDEAQKMNHLVMNLLSLNELEFGDDMLDIQRFDICELIRGIAMTIGAKADEKGAVIECGIPETQFVWGDEYKIEEVLNNYLGNALNHVEPMESNVGIIRVSIETIENRIRVKVFNTGKNIPLEDQPRIWEKFYKVDKAHTREYGGNGIGLSIVKAIMEAHSQSYGVINREDGVEFWFELETA